MNSNKLLISNSEFSTSSQQIQQPQQQPLQEQQQQPSQQHNTGNGNGRANAKLVCGGRSTTYGSSRSDPPIAGLYELEQTIGQGHFAVVKSARHVFSGERVAVKIIDKTKLDPISRDHLFQEVKCMKLVQHPNVVRLYEVIDSPGKLYLILELGDGGDMYDYIMKHSNGLSEKKSKRYFRQIVRAIKYCHELHVVHRDLKPENVVFFTQTGQVKLTDFGFSNIYQPGSKLYTSCGSLAYSAPEILLGDSYLAPPVDVWSLGVILYMLVTGRAPFQEASDSETLTMILDCKYYLPSYLSADCIDLITRMLVRNPNDRISVEDIYNHNWLKHDYDYELSKQESNESSDDNYYINENYNFLNSLKKSFKRTSNSLLNNTTANNEDELLNPLIKREHLSEKENRDIILQMINGKIATEDEIMIALDEDKYNYITATYYLLAERFLKKEYSKRKRTKLNNKKAKKALSTESNDLISTSTSTPAAAAVTTTTITSSSTAMPNNKQENTGVIMPTLNTTNVSLPSTSDQSATDSSSLATASSLLSKNNFSNMMKMHKKMLLRQKEQVKDELEEENEDELAEEDEDQFNDNQAACMLDNQTTSVNKNHNNEGDLLNGAESFDQASTSTAAALPSNLSNKQLTNILEDEEDCESIKVPCSSSAAAAGVGSTTTGILSTSRRSSRGGLTTGDNLISSLTIPEEVDESDLVFPGPSFNTIYNRLEPISAKQIKVNENTSCAEANKAIFNRRQSSSADEGNNEDEQSDANQQYGDYDFGSGTRSKFSINEAFTDSTHNGNHNHAPVGPQQHHQHSYESHGSFDSNRNSRQLINSRMVMSSSGAETSDSDCELVKSNHLKHDLLLLKDHEWNRSASSRSRNKQRSNTNPGHMNGTGAAVMGEYLLVDNEGVTRDMYKRPLSISSESYMKDDATGGGASAPGGMVVTRAKSLAEQPIPNIAYRNSLSVTGSNSHDQLNAQTAAALFNARTLSVEHRQANMSQMSISSQLSKNNSVRYHRSVTGNIILVNTTNNNQGNDTSSLLQQQSTTPTPRESLVFNRGDEKPIAKILLHRNLTTESMPNENTSPSKSHQHGYQRNDSDDPCTIQPATSGAPIIALSLPSTETDSEENTLRKYDPKSTSIPQIPPPPTPPSTNPSALGSQSQLLTQTHSQSSSNTTTPQSAANHHKSINKLIKNKIDNFNNSPDTKPSHKSSTNPIRYNNDSYSNAIKNQQHNSNNKPPAQPVQPNSDYDLVYDEDDDFPNNNNKSTNGNHTPNNTSNPISAKTNSTFTTNKTIDTSVNKSKKKNNTSANNNNNNSNNDGSRKYKQHSNSNKQYGKESPANNSYNNFSCTKCCTIL